MNDQDLGVLMGQWPAEQGGQRLSQPQQSNIAQDLLLKFLMQFAMGSRPGSTAPAQPGSFQRYPNFTAAREQAAYDPRQTIPQSPPSEMQVALDRVGNYEVDTATRQNVQLQLMKLFRMLSGNYGGPSQQNPVPRVASDPLGLR